MTLSFRSASLLGACVALLGASVGAADAMPASPLRAGLGTPVGVEQAAFLRRKYSHRSMRRNAPNHYCQSQPSRCH